MKLLKIRRKSLINRYCFFSNILKFFFYDVPFLSYFSKNALWKLSKKPS
ncbi:hypothetical protein D922_02076 [Enterococcus faecalis 06-MB-DW-09]|nr:hypothetical protein D931_03358 [Enterococcus faecium 13.SD.W.09]EPH93534.1 hypothetical protein D922_02076 [Enterococcus faecalis 06-MB-DW-09]